jgi:hypothetical protein
VRSRWVLIAGIAALALELAPCIALAQPRSPEKETLEISRHLKPISDEEWKAAAGERISENYLIIAGDTLFDISKRLFGDARYWPKLYALNNDTITNPHLIRPGKGVRFMPGSGTSLPAVALTSDGASGGKSGPNGEKAKKRSEEWKALPRQAWESSNLKLPENVDKFGIDMGSKVTFGKPKGFDLDAVSASDRLPFLGQVVAGRTSAAYVSTGDTVYVRADDTLQIGETYAITQEPIPLKAKRSDRIGLSYPILAKVKIIGVRDELFVGVITSSRSFTPRGTR